MIECVLRRVDGVAYPLAVARDPIVIGRDEAQIQLDSEYTSQRHCEVFERDGEVVLRDLDSRNGTTVNGQRIQETVLQTEDSLNIGEVLFTFSRNDRPGPRQLVQSMFAAIRPALEQQLPRGCTIREYVCLEFLLAGIKKGDNPSDLLSQCVERITADPERFIDGYREILKTRAGEIFDQLQGAISSKLPFGCSLKRGACIELLMATMRSGLEPEKLVARFVDQLKASPRSYLDGLPSPQAHSGFHSGAPYRTTRSEVRRG